MRLIFSYACQRLVESMADVYPETDWQRREVHFYSNVMSHVPRKNGREVVAMLKAIHTKENRDAVRRKTTEVAENIRKTNLINAEDLVDKPIEETLTYYGYPSQHWLKMKTNNPIKQLMKKIRRRTKVVGALPDGNSALLLLSARLRHISTTHWGQRKNMNMYLLKELDTEKLHQGA